MVVKMIVECQSAVCGKVVIKLTSYVRPLITLAHTACLEGVSPTAICTNCFAQLCFVNSGMRRNPQILNADSAMLRPLDVQLTLFKGGDFYKFSVKGKFFSCCTERYQRIVFIYGIFRLIYFQL